MSARDVENILLKADPGGPTTTSRKPRPGSSTSTRLTRSRAKPTTRRSTPRRLRRRRSAGAAEDPRGDDSVGAARRAAASNPHQEFLTIDTTNILFVCGGSFAELDKVIERRFGGTAASAFGAEISSRARRRTRAEWFEQVLPEDLIEYGPDPRVHRPPAQWSLRSTKLSRDDPDHDPD